MLDATTIRDVVNQLDWTGTGTSAERLTNLFDLARWAITFPQSELMQLGEGDAGAPRWTESLFGDEQLRSARAKFAAGERIALRVPITVRPKSGVELPSYFDVFLQHDDRLTKGEDHYIRQGITITAIRLLADRGVRGLVVVNHKAISTLLGDSENPSHTDWVERSNKLKERYHYGPSCVRFVRGALKTLSQFLSRPPEGPDENLLRDVFYLPTELGTEPQRRRRTRRPVPGGEPPIVNPPPPPRRSRFQLTRVPGGFRVSGQTQVTRPAGIRVRVAYNVRGRGGQLRYSPFDFDIGRSPISIQATNATVTSAESNILEFRPIADDFQVEVLGFDTRRDLKIKADSVEDEE